MKVLGFLLLLVLSCYALKDLGYGSLNCIQFPSYPQDVNRVRPADINVIAAMGNSLSAGYGAGATNMDQLSVEWRGMTFVMGGDKNLTEHITIPNILKIFNPKLFGQSFEQSTAEVWEFAQLDAAVSGAKAINMSQQARDLVSRMKAHPEQINMESDWKLIHLFIGANDACYYCKTGPSNSSISAPSAYKAYIEEAIRILYDSVPRAIVSIVAMLNVDMLAEIDKTNALCQALHQNECACDTPENIVDVRKLCEDYRTAVMQIQDEGKFEKQDFTVVVQPIFADIHYPPFDSEGNADTTFFAPDCFHFSQYGHAVVAKLLWNSLLQPVGNKTSNYNLSNPTFELLCPNQDCPFIRTVINSKSC